MEKFVAQSVVRRLKRGQPLGVETPQKVSQGAAVWKVGEAQDGWNQSVVNQTLSFLDSASTSHDGKEVSEKKIRGMVLLVGVIGPANVELQEATQP